MFCEHCGVQRTFDACGRLRCSPCRNAAVTERRINERISKRGRQSMVECAGCGGMRKPDTGGQLRCAECSRKQRRDYNRERQRMGTLIPTGTQAGKTIKPPRPPKPLWQPAWAAQSRPEIVAAVRDYRRASRSLGARG